jgi:hypothetical protein
MSSILTKTVNWNTSRKSLFLFSADGAQSLRSTWHSRRRKLSSEFLSWREKVNDFAPKRQVISGAGAVHSCSILTDDNTPDPPQTEHESKSTRPPDRPFNPLVNYLFFAAAVLAAYVLYYYIGFPAVIALMLFFVIRLIRDALIVVKTYEYKFARQAAVANLVFSMTFFMILVVNGIAISQTGIPIFLADFQDLTSWTPIFILGGVFGMSNIKRMWGPQPTP